MDPACIGTCGPAFPGSTLRLDRQTRLCHDLYTSSHFKSMIKLQPFYFAALLAAVSATSSLAQDAPTLRKGNTELGFFVGGGYGLGVSSDAQKLNPGDTVSVTGSSLHVMGGADVGYAITKNFFLVGEASYFPVLGNVDVRSSDATPTTKATLQTDHTYDRRSVEFNGGVHYRLPVPESRVVPYLVGAIGGVHFSTGNVVVTQTNLSNNVPSSLPGQGPLTPQTAFAVNGGAGIRFYVTEHFGFRGEFRMFRPFGIPYLTSFYRVAGGIYFQLK
jgi:hypothetical protein